MANKLEQKEIFTPYDAGYDCGLNGANATNSSFRWFLTRGNMEEWQLGKHDAERVKSKILYNGK